MVHQALLLIHITGVIIWVGGMFFAYFCLRPAAAKLLSPAQRLPLWLATLGTFFRAVAVAVVAILASGLAMFLQVGFAGAPIGWYVMASFGIAMAVVYAYVYSVFYPRLSRHCAAGAWPEAGSALNGIRRLVAGNLALAGCALVGVISAR
jgi:uncharacterized membrane protein